MVRLLRSIAPWAATELFVVPPATAGSLGDQSILQGILDALPETRRRRVRQLLPSGFEPQRIRSGGDPSTLRLVLHSRRWVVGFLLALVRCRHLVVLGADVMDGRYNRDQALTSLQACRLAAAAGVPVRVAGFSFSDQPDPTVVDAMRSMPGSVEFCLRDPVSLERFKGATGRTPTLVADAAFLMKPDAESQPAREARAFCRAARGRGERVVGVNINPLTLAGSPEQSIQAYAADLSVLMSEHPAIRLILIPHDVRPQQSDAQALGRLSSLMATSLQKRVSLVGAPLNAWDARAVVGEVDLVITGRMHLAISALSQGVPAVGITYMGKFEGLMKHFSLDAMLVSPTEVLHADHLRTVVTSALVRRAEIAATIDRALPSVVALARGNVAGLR